jgi:acetyl-CoA synthetase
MLQAFRGASAEELRRRFRWAVPVSYNLAVDACDRQPPGSVAVIHAGEDGAVEELRYGDLSASSGRLANVLRGFGVARGDRVAVILPQGPKVAVSHLAVYKLGAIAVPLTTLFGPDGLRVRLQDSGAKIVITDAATDAKVEALVPELPALEGRLVVERDWDDLLSRASSRFQPEDTRADDPALLIYTSGTTGGPKGALHAHRVLLGHLPGFELSHDFYGQPGDRLWTPADWAWIGGLFDALFPVLHHGSSIVSDGSPGPFDPERAMATMARHGVRNAFLPPTALKLMRQAGVGPPAGLELRSVMSGGESLGEEMLDWVRGRLGVTVNEIYGQTECNYVVGNAGSLYAVKPGSMGRAYPGHDVAVLDESGRETGDVGEVAVRRPDPVMFLGYWGRARETAEKFRGEWMLTGDLARRDGEGYLWFEGRKDDVINSAGYRIGPTEVEDCLMRHPAVAMAAVVGVPDAVRGQVVKAYVVARPDARPDPALAAQIQDFVRRRLAAYQYPRQIEFVDEMPLTTTGKIRRSELRARHARR